MLPCLSYVQYIHVFGVNNNHFIMDKQGKNNKTNWTLNYSYAYCIIRRTNLHLHEKGRMTMDGSLRKCFIYCYGSSGSLFAAISRHGQELQFQPY